jgi:hypothetical protein
MNSVFSIHGIKVPLFPIPGMYADLTGGALDTSKFVPWAQLADSIVAAGANSVTLVVSAGVEDHYTDNGFDPSLTYNPSDDDIRAVASLFQSRGLNVALGMGVSLVGILTGDGSLQGADRPKPTDRALWQQTRLQGGGRRGSR